MNELPPHRQSSPRSGRATPWACLCCASLCACPPPAAVPAEAPGTVEGEGAAAPQNPASKAMACAGALLCEDFEDHVAGEPPSAPWVDATGDSGATVTVSSERSHSGKQSVHVHAGTGKAYRRGYFAIHGEPVFPAAGREMYGRAMIWLAQAPHTPAGMPDVHWTIVQGEGRSADDRFNSLYRYGGQHQGGRGLMANFETTPPVRTDCWQHSKALVPLQRWACVQWHFSAEGHEMQLWLDGEPLEDIHIQKRGGPESGCLGHDLEDEWLAPPAFQSLYLGWERYQQPDDDRDIWFDDIAVSTEPVACPEPGPQQ